MSPLFAGAANSTNKFLGNLSSDPGSNNAEGDLYYNTSEDLYKFYNGSSWSPINTPDPGTVSSAAIENDTQAASWASTTTGNEGYPWVKISGVNSGSPFQVYSKYADSKLYCMAGRWCGSDNNATNAGSGKIRWECNKNPNDNSSGNQNDWGSLTHVFNETVDYSISSNKTSTSKSARTLLWNHTCNRTLWTFSGVEQSADLLWDMSASESMATRMKTRGPNSGTDYFRNGSGGVQYGSRVDSGLRSGYSAVDSSWSNIRIGITDGEDVNAGSNDVFMIRFDASDDWANDNGVGWKRSNVTGNWGSSLSFDTSNDNNNAASNTYGVVAENCDNGAMKNRANGIICCLVNAF